METLCDYTETLKQRAERDWAWEILRPQFVSTAPRRFVSGIAISSCERNANGDSFDSRGVVSMEIPFPLLWGHEWNRPIGKVTGIEVQGDQLHFHAEITNGGLIVADEVWHGLVRRLGHGVSVGPVTLRGKDAIGCRWGLREISISETGADPGARITRCWERANVIYFDRSRDTVHWSESE